MFKADFPPLLKKIHILLFTLAVAWSGPALNAGEEVQDPGWPRVLETGQTAARPSMHPDHAVADFVEPSFPMKADSCWW